MSIQLKRQVDQPLYLQAADQLRAKIEAGELAPHTRLPASRVLAKKLGVNRITIVNAYAELEAEGLVVTRVGSGTFVAGRPDSNSSEMATDQPTLWRGSPPRRHWNANQMFAEMMRMARQPGVISFAVGTPASEFLPVNEFRRAINDVLRRDGAAALQYDEAAGYLPLRNTIAGYLEQKHIEVTGDDILITAGCQQALNMALRGLTRGRDNVLIVEDPCYLGLLDIITAQHITPVGVPLDEDGLRIDRLEQLILRHRPQLIYVIPSFHNPTGITMPLERRRELLDIAAHYGVPILEDTSYDELRYVGKSLPSLKSLDTADIVLHAGGFSKTLVPGIRIGYLVAPPALRDRMIASKQTADILTSPLNQRALHTYLQTGHFADHLQQVRLAYQERLEAMLAAMERYFPAEACWHRPDGGMYIWVEMPSHGPTATNLYLTAINYNVAFAIGSVFSASGSFPQALRLNFTTHPPAEIEEGIRRLGKAWKELLARQDNSLQPNRPSAVPIL
ncbi:MAG TPA: PLP-dependent aminotransferase family protein [Anaerolineae bacterium]|jgi:GntR family transcriptional regulator/MocR family aminotransferase